jgi:hypothetical protein
MDRAFVAEMIPHHESAVEMAEMALDQGESEFVEGIANDIVRTQNDEISTMREIDRQLAEQAVERGTMEMPAQEMGAARSSTSSPARPSRCASRTPRRAARPRADPARAPPGA